jgi:hypothetical protein
MTLSLKVLITSSNPPILSNVVPILEGGTISPAMICSYSLSSRESKLISDPPALRDDRISLPFFDAFLRSVFCGSRLERTYRTA